jgi:hypothetical protein
MVHDECRSDDKCCRKAIERQRTVGFKVALAYFIFMFSAAADSSKNCSLLIQWLATLYNASVCTLYIAISPPPEILEPKLWEKHSLAIIEKYSFCCIDEVKISFLHGPLCRKSSKETQICICFLAIIVYWTMGRREDDVPFHHSLQ